MKVRSTCFATKESKGGSAGITCDNGRKYGVKHRSAINNCGADICVTNPGESFIVGDGNVWVTIICLITKIQGAVGGDSNRWIAFGLMTPIGGIVFLAIAGRAWNGSDAPSDAVVLRHDDGLLTRFVEGKGSAAAFVRHIDRPVRPNFDVTV